MREVNLLDNTNHDYGLRRVKIAVKLTLPIRSNTAKDRLGEAIPALQKFRLMHSFRSLIRHP
jgi:hypothetical protein